MGLEQLLEECPRKPILSEGGFELVLVLEFLALLRRHVRFEKGLARVVRLSGQSRRGQAKNKRDEQG